MDLGVPLLCIFQFTPLREGRPLRDGTVSGGRDYFNSRPSARGDNEVIRQRKKRNISIHAPPRGATMLMRQHIADYEISIHAPPRGATCTSISTPAVFLFQFTPLREGRRKVFPSILRNVYFNSRPSARGDSTVRAMFEKAKRISIHAPPRGATRSNLRASSI